VNIRRIGQIALLIFGLLPFLYFILYFTIVGSGERTTNIFLIILFAITAISIPGAFIFYVVDVFRNNSIRKDQKYFWIALLLFGNNFIYPFYWYSHIWKEPKNESVMINSIE
jgi:hypothetical protein